MPRDKGSSGRKRRASGGRKEHGGGRVVPDIVPDLEAEGAPYRFRQLLFVTLTAVVVAGAVFFASHALKDTGEKLGRLQMDSDPERCYTVKMRVAPEAEKQVAEAFLRQPAVVSLAAGSELFLRTLPDGKIVLCAGSFETPDDPSAQVLLERIKGFELQGVRVFNAAHIGPYDPVEAP